MTTITEHINGKTTYDLTAGEDVPSGFVTKKVTWNIEEKVQELDAFAEQMQEQDIDPTIGMFTLLEALNTIVGNDQTGLDIKAQVVLVGATMAHVLSKHLEMYYAEEEV